MKALAPPCPGQSYHSKHKPRQTGLYGQAWEEEASLSIFQLKFEKSFLSAVAAVAYHTLTNRRYNTYQLVVKELWRGSRYQSNVALPLASFTWVNLTAEGGRNVFSQSQYSTHRLSLRVLVVRENLRISEDQRVLGSLWVHTRDGSDGPATRDHFCARNANRPFRP